MTITNFTDTTKKDIYTTGIIPAGEYTLKTCRNGSVFITHRSGEGVEIKGVDFRKVVKKLFEKNF